MWFMAPSVGTISIEPEKCLHICRKQDEAMAKVAFLLKGLKPKFVRGARYLGGYIGGKIGRDEWVREKIDKWVDGVKILASICKRYPQTAYAGLTASLQAEWQYVMRVVPGISYLFTPLEEALRGHFLPNLVCMESIDGDLRKIMSQGVKQAGFGVRNRVEWADEVYQMSKSACAELTDAMVNHNRLHLG